MTFGAVRDFSSQVVVIPMTSFGMPMKSRHIGLQGMCPQKRRSLPRLPQVVNERIIANSLTDAFWECHRQAGIFGEFQNRGAPYWGGRMATSVLSPSKGALRYTAAL
jgi:hypothetical protein